MYSAELERHKKEKEEWKRKAERLEDKASALQVNRRDPVGVVRSGARTATQLVLTSGCALLCSAPLSASSTWTRPTLLWSQPPASPTSWTCRRSRWRS